MKFIPVIGLEVHVQAKTKSKMFCGCPADVFGKEPNSMTCPVCLGLPGAIPVPNKRAVEKTVLLAKALGCEITKFSQFERKNYFYPDLPKGFQISQYAGPVGAEGKFEGISISRVHLEEDTGRLLHEESTTLVDFNRSGIPLIEVVTEPEFFDPAAVSRFSKELRIIIVHLGISDADMEKGSLRLEANISLRKKGMRELPPYKVELKNINSFAFLEKGLRVEIERQTKLLEKGKKIEQETRGYDQRRGITVAQRRKEEAFDYRYFPEPDIPPLTGISLKTEEEIYMPREVREKYRALGLPPQYSDVLVRNRELASIFDVVRREIPVDSAANIIINKRFGDPLKMGAKGLVAAYKRERKKEVLSGGELKAVAEKVVLDNQAAVRDYASGKEAALQFLLGQLMRETKGKVGPEEGKKLLKRLIDARTKTSPTKD